MQAMSYGRVEQRGSVDPLLLPTYQKTWVASDSVAGAPVA